MFSLFSPHVTNLDCGLGWTCTPCSHAHIFFLTLTMHTHALFHTWHTLLPCLHACKQSTPYHVLPPVQAHGDRLCMYPPGVQVVQLGDPRFHWWETLVGICGQLCDPGAAGRWVWKKVIWLKCTCKDLWCILWFIELFYILLKYLIWLYILLVV